MTRHGVDTAQDVGNRCSLTFATDFISKNEPWISYYDGTNHRLKLAYNDGDTWQLITTRFQEQAAEYEGPSGKTVYIKKSRDDGEPIYENTRPDRNKFAGDRLPGIEQLPSPAGSVADVSAKGAWVDGHWQLELSRKLDTGHADDAVLAKGKQRRGAIGVFERGSAEHKSVSGELLFDFGALR